MSVNAMICIIPAEAEKSTNFMLLMSSLFIFPLSSIIQIIGGAFQYGGGERFLSHYHSGFIFNL